MKSNRDWRDTVAAAHAAGASELIEEGIIVHFTHRNLLDARFHWFDFQLYIDEQRSFLAEYGPWLAAHEPGGTALLDRMRRLVDACAEVVARSDVTPDREHVPLRLCRVDSNLANAIWCDDGRLRWVDWEYSGSGDPALDLSDFRWHAALDGLSDEQHAWLRENYRRPEGDETFDERLKMWDRILVTRWPLLILRSLWSQHNGPDRVRLTQAVVDVAEVRARLVRFIERAEWLV